MKVVLPKSFRGVAFPKLFDVTLNEFDIERLLPSLFFLVATTGSVRGARVNDPKTLEGYLDALATHPQLSGFESNAGKRLLGRWVRTSLLKVGAVGKARLDEQIEYLYPLTFLAYKAGWPAEASRQRKVDQFLFQRLCARLDANGTTPPPTVLKEVFRQTFGRGLELDPVPPFDGRYDGKTPLDVETLLELFFLDGLTPTPAGQRKVGPGEEPILSRIADNLADDILIFLIKYRAPMPVAALTRSLMSLVNFELFVYTAKLAFAVDELVRTREIPKAMTNDPAGSAPEIFVDFTRQRESSSDDLARTCVVRDLQAMRTLYGHMIRLRALGRAAEVVPSLAREVDSEEGAQYLRALIRAQSTPEVQAHSQAEFQAIRAETLAGVEGTPEEEEFIAYFKDAVLRAEDSVDLSVDLLARGQERLSVEPLLRWFGSVGGLNRPFGLLRGLSVRRSSWRYQMTDDLLATLVQLSIASQEGAASSRIKLSEFLAFLEDRFGILVDRPPAFSDDTGTRAAARANLDAMKRRLRQMGFFADLSDDFSAQYLELGATE